ncbi:MAG: ABC transporter ATP-binding protein [Ilumatobacteraceae bacterium]
MSGGERQRVVIARALAQDTPVLVLDEPTSALDIGHQQQAMELVARLRAERRLTVIAAMHDLTLASVYSDRLALLHDGELVAEGTPAEVLDPDTLAKYYGANVKVQIEADGTVVVIRVAAATSGRPGRYDALERSCCAMSRALSIGIANPMFDAWTLTPLAATAVLMPITRPPASTSGPPELPELMAASVWINPDSVPLAVSIERSSAETMPA